MLAAIFKHLIQKIFYFIGIFPRGYATFKPQPLPEIPATASTSPLITLSLSLSRRAWSPYLQTLSNRRPLNRSGDLRDNLTHRQITQIFPTSSVTTPVDSLKLLHLKHIFEIKSEAFLLVHHSPPPPPETPNSD
jgi:hypothetical protein